MTVMTERGVVPTWTLGDRIRKAREHAELNQQELADELTVARQSVNNWENGRQPLRVMLREIARVTGVDAEWLTGDIEVSLLPRVDSNHQPADCRFDDPNSDEIGISSAVFHDHRKSIPPELVNQFRSRVRSGRPAGPIG